MELPDYFLIDLPPETPLTPTLLTEACQTLKRNRDRYLLSRSTTSLVKTLCHLGDSWLDPEFPFRQHALDVGPEATGFSRQTLTYGLDTFFAQLTPENFEAWLAQEFGHPERLEELTSTRGEKRMDRAALARGPALIAHVTAGNIPNPALMSMIAGLLVRSAQFVKCASGTSFLPRLFAHSLYEREPKLGACLELVEWPGGREDLEKVVFHESGCVTATGGEQTLDAIHARLPRSKRFLGYGHRVSFAYVAKSALGGFHTKKLIENAARDIVTWDQLGCLSPHVIYVQHRGEISSDHFAQLLAEYLEAFEQKEPRRTLGVEEAAAIASRRGFYEIRAAHVTDTVHWFSEDSTAWTVIYEADIRFQTSCLNRFIYVKPVESLEEALHGAEPIRHQVSTVGLAAGEDEAQELANQLARWGVPRICPIGRMQNPPLGWRHDGRPTLADLVSWTDWEM